MTEKQNSFSSFLLFLQAVYGLSSPLCPLVVFCGTARRQAATSRAVRFATQPDVCVNAWPNGEYVSGLSLVYLTSWNRTVRVVKEEYFTKQISELACLKFSKFVLNHYKIPSTCLFTFIHSFYKFIFTVQLFTLNKRTRKLPHSDGSKLNMTMNCSSSLETACPSDWSIILAITSNNLSLNRAAAAAAAAVAIMVLWLQSSRCSVEAILIH